MGTIASSLHNADKQDPVEMEFDQNNPPSLTITRQEVAALTDVLGRISHHFVAREEPGPVDAFTLTVVDDYVQPTLFTTSSQEEMYAPTTSMSNPHLKLPCNTNTRGKRRRPKYSLTLGMLKKYPILKFSATGPLGAKTSPHKWWCRVCKVELSLMSRGSLEMLSHYRSDAHLVEEHRNPMDVPGTPIYDKDGKELFGISLQEAKKKARETCIHICADCKCSWIPYPDDSDSPRHTKTSFHWVNHQATYFVFWVLSPFCIIVSR